MSFPFLWATLILTVELLGCALLLGRGVDGAISKVMSAWDSTYPGARKGPLHLIDWEAEV